MNSNERREVFYNLERLSDKMRMMRVILEDINNFVQMHKRKEMEKTLKDILIPLDE